MAVMKNDPRTLQDLFLLGMKRQIPDLAVPPEGPQLNLGPGNSHIIGTQELDWPEWDAETYRIPWPDDTFACVHAYHFLEHLYHPVKMIKEVSRVLKPRGVFNILVPHAHGIMAFKDLDHKAFFTIEAFSKAKDNDAYSKDKGLGQLSVHFSIMMAVEEGNLAILCQMIKETQ